MDGSNPTGEDKVANVSGTPRGAKMAYGTPRLVTYGHVAELTLGGVSGAEEGSLGMNPNMSASDRLAKENISQICIHSLGIGLYLFDYKPEFRDAWGHGRQFGVMADEVEAVMPEAVSIHVDGYKMVNYALLGIRRPLH